MNVKRWIAIFLAIVLTLSLIAGVLPAVLAVEAYTIGLRDGNQKDKITAAPGSTVEAYLYLAGNPGILSAGVLLNCPDGVEITKAESALSGHNFTPVWQYSKAYTVTPYLVWMLAPTGTTSNALVTYNGNWCKITFRIAEDIDDGDYTISLSAPRDKNLTAETASGVIKPNTSTYVTGISVANLTITVEGPDCNHTWGHWSIITAATCLKAGKQERECSLCYKVQEQVLDATGHTMGSWTQTAKPTCTTAGSEKRVCQNANCGYTETRTVSELGHKFSDPKITQKPTCTKAGEQAGECINCGENTTQSIPATGHTMGSWTQTAKPTCTTAGSEKSTCKNGCGYSETREIAKLGHQFAEATVEKEPTCEENGLQAGKCENCGKDTKEIIPATGHDFAESEILCQPTAETPGLKKSKCSRCGEVKEEEIPCIVEETTGETTGAETLPDESVPEETLPVSDTPMETVLKTVIIIASTLLLGILILVVVVTIRSKKK